MRDIKAKYLRLVDLDNEADAVTNQSVSLLTDFQSTLFSDSSNFTLGFIAIKHMSDRTFQSLLSDVRPKYIFDLRRVPTFSIGVLNRKTIFALFDAYKIRYLDVAGALDISSPRDASSNPKLLMPKIMQTLLRTRKPLVGPVLLFLDEEFINEQFIDGVESALPHQDGRGWEIVLWQEGSPSILDTAVRKTVFISHANPEDNDAALWFGARLAAEGYEIWSDITKLIGGEYFWDSIENIIRNKSGCVIVLLSRKGHDKAGVLDEVNVAISTERQLKLDTFVLPVRVDDLPFGQIRANLARKNVIDGSKNLSNALTEILTALEDMNLPKEVDDVSYALSTWRKSREEVDGRADPRTYLTIQNAVEVSHWPNPLRKSPLPRLLPRFQSDVVRPFLATGHVSGGHLCFAEGAELERWFADRDLAEVGASAALVNGLDEDVIGALDLSWSEARRAVSRIVRSSWNEMCRQRGLLRYEMSSGHSCWYVPIAGDGITEVQFVDVDGKKKRRNLVGRSNKRGVYWHLGIEANFDHTSNLVRLRSHVIFSYDGKRPIVSNSKQHSLRRAFCRNWWNDRWRTLIQGMLSFLAQGRDEICLPVSPSSSIRVRSCLSIVDGFERGGTLTYYEEPPLEFGHNQRALDPREGLMLYGPHKFVRNPKSVRIGVVGAPEGIELFSQWCIQFKKLTKTESEASGVHQVPFIGFDAVFGAEWPVSPIVSRPIPRTDLLNAIRLSEKHQAVAKTVGLFVDEIYQAVHQDDVNVDIWFVVVPEEVFVLGRPTSRVPRDIAVRPDNPLTRRIAARFTLDSPSLFAKDNEVARVFEYHADFHHQLKNRLLDVKAVTQIFRESSIMHAISTSSEEQQEEGENNREREQQRGLQGSRRMQEPSDVHWNIGTACYFKSGGRPWKVTTARPGVCYVGLIFKRDPRRGGNNHCCGAQLFLESGEGVVFKGALGPWYSADSKQFHLSKAEAKNLMTVALDSYRAEHNVYPLEVFVHGRTRFNYAELEGFREAARHETEVTGVRITRTSEVKLYTDGLHPVNRGTALMVSEKLGYLWTSGFVEHLQTYQGRETPNPLRVEICGESNASLSTVLKDVMTLTKMNFNSCVFADGMPVSMRFADAIGDVLVSTYDREVPPLPFRHYI